MNPSNVSKVLPVQSVALCLPLTLGKTLLWSSCCSVCHCHLTNFCTDFPAAFCLFLTLWKLSYIFTAVSLLCRYRRTNRPIERHLSVVCLSVLVCWTADIVTVFHLGMTHCQILVIIMVHELFFSFFFIKYLFFIFIYIFFYVRFAQTYCWNNYFNPHVTYV